MYNGPWCLGWKTFHHIAGPCSIVPCCLHTDCWWLRNTGVWGWERIGSAECAVCTQHHTTASPRRHTAARGAEICLCFLFYRNWNDRSGSVPSCYPAGPALILEYVWDFPFWGSSDLIFWVSISNNGPKKAKKKYMKHSIKFEMKFWIRCVCSSQNIYFVIQPLIIKKKTAVVFSILRLSVFFLYFPNFCNIFPSFKGKGWNCRALGVVPFATCCVCVHFIYIYIDIGA